MATAELLQYNQSDDITDYSMGLLQYNVTTAAPPPRSSCDYTPEVEALVKYYYGVATDMTLYVAPILIIGGTLGNLLVAVVVLSRHFRGSPSSLLLVALAAVDTAVLHLTLWNLFFTQFDPSHANALRQSGEAGCRLGVFLTNFTTHLSSWILVLINVDRVVSVYEPLKARVWCSRRRLAVALAVTVVALAGINSQAFWSQGLSTSGRCMFTTSRAYTQTWNVLDAVLFSFAPFVLIAGCNVAIVAGLVRARRRRLHITSASSSAGGAGSTQQQDGTTSITVRR